MNLLTVFLTGLITGGLTCLAVQGGLLASTLAQREQDRLKRGLTQNGNAAAIIFFLAAKVTVYTLLGFLLGWFGSIFKFSLTAQIIMQIIVAIFMIGTALNMLNVHPFFRYFVIQPPKFLIKLVRKQSKNADFFAPTFLGAFTIFIPCGTTQAMMALSIASANPLMGALILFFFTLGTSPVFFVLGYLTARLGEIFNSKFTKAAAIAIILLAVFNLNSAITLTGSKYTLSGLFREVYCTAFAYCDTKVLGLAQAVGEATINFETNRYNPSTLTVKTGSNITLKLRNQSGRGCIQAFTIPKLGIQKIVPPGTSETITFTAPDKPQDIAFMCSMGMYRGTIRVI